ncbi:MAG: hypothetical protein ACYC3I_14760 [Gemmataceae bacterium]
MNPLKMSALFAAYAWFIRREGEGATAQKEAVLFARANWTAFLPCAHAGLGRLLIRMAEMPKKGSLRRKNTTASLVG